MISDSHEVIKQFASRYIWWKSPDEGVALPARVIAQVMNMGDYADVQALVSQVGDDALRSVLERGQRKPQGIGLFW
jgi:hypothetical protein